MIQSVDFRATWKSVFSSRFYQLLFQWDKFLKGQLFQVLAM